MKQNKYNYVKVIQVHTMYGWEDCAEYEKSEFGCIRSDLREYRLSSPDSYRLINRRVLVEL